MKNEINERPFEQNVPS